MKAIVRIASAELKAMFYSPIAWILLIVFILHTGLMFNGQVGALQNMQLSGFGGFRPLTVLLFTSSVAFFAGMFTSLFLYIPLLTMGVISRELQSGSINLLLSSPVRVSDIVLGKYLALAVYSLLLTLVVVAYMLTMPMIMVAPDYMAVVSALLGFFLVICAYAAVGLFMSSLTQYQIVAAIATWTILGLFTAMGELGAGIPWLRDVTHWISMNGRYDVFRVGLIDSKNIVYFLAFIGMFLGFAMVKLSSGRKVESRLHVQAKYFAVVAIAAGAFYLASQPTLRFVSDFTRGETMTLSPVSQEVMKQIDGPWNITTYANILDRGSYSGLPSSQNNDFDFFHTYTRFNPELTMDYVLYYAESSNKFLTERNPGKSLEEIAREFSLESGIDFEQVLSPEQVGKIADVDAEERGFFRVLSYGGQESRLRMYMDSRRVPLEKEVIASVKQLVVGAKRIGVVAGNGERGAYSRGDDDIQKIMTDVTYREAAINNGFLVEEARLDVPIPGHIDVLVIANPAEPYSAEQLQRIDSFIESGGNMIVLTEPGSGESVNPLLARFGAQIIGGRVSEVHEDYPDDFVFARYSDQATAPFGPPPLLEHRPIVLKGVATIEALPGSDFDFEPILVSDTSTMSHTEGKEGSLTLSGMLSRQLDGGEQRIFVAGDTGFMTNAGLSESISNNNQDFVFDLFRWVSDDVYPIDEERPPFLDREVIIDRDGRSLLKTFNYGVVPGLLLLMGFGLLFVRHRR